MNREMLKAGVEKNMSKSFEDIFLEYRGWLKLKVPNLEAELLPVDEKYDEKIEKIESLSGVKLPKEFLELYKLCGGESEDGLGVIFGVKLLSLDDVIKQLESWISLIDAEDDPETLEQYATSFESHPKGAIDLIYAKKKWIPVTNDWAGNHIGLDMAPGPEGKLGQVINFGRDEEIKCVIGSSLKEFFAMMLFFAQEEVYQINEEDENVFTIVLSETFIHDQLRSWLY